MLVKHETMEDIYIEHETSEARIIQNALLEMERLDIEIIGVSEMTWPNSSY